VDQSLQNVTAVTGCHFSFPLQSRERGDAGSLLQNPCSSTCACIIHGLATTTHTHTHTGYDSRKTKTFKQFVKRWLYVSHLSLYRFSMRFMKHDSIVCYSLSSTFKIKAVPNNFKKMLTICMKYAPTCYWQHRWIPKWWRPLVGCFSLSATYSYALTRKCDVIKNIETMEGRILSGCIWRNRLGTN